MTCLRAERPSFGDRRPSRSVPASEFPRRLACARPAWSAGPARHAGGDLGRVAQGLQHDAIALGQLQQAVDAILRLVRIEREGEADRAEPDRRGAIDAKRAAEIEVALGLESAAGEAEFERGG